MAGKPLRQQILNPSLKRFNDKRVSPVKKNTIVADSGKLE